jgi:hypothetical protein
VDVFFRVKSMTVAVEVKCPAEEDHASHPTCTVMPAGRITGGVQAIERMRQTLLTLFVLPVLYSIFHRDVKR